MGRAKRIWYLSPMRAAKVQASLRIRAVSPEPSLLAHTSSESRGTFRQKARSPAPLNGWACAVKVCHDGMLEDTNSLDGAHMMYCGNEIHTGDMPQPGWDVTEQRTWQKPVSRYHVPCSQTCPPMARNRHKRLSIWHKYIYIHLFKTDLIKTR